MFIPIRTDSPLRTTPYANYALVTANVLVFILQSLRPNLTDGLQLYAHSPELPAFFTYAFLHGGPMHLIGNMVFLYIFGNNVNDRMGNVGYLCFYLAGGVFAGIGYVVTQDDPIGVVGASGAVAAVTGAYLVLFPRATITVFYIFILIGTLEIPSFFFILFFFAKDLLGWAGEQSMVAHNAHVSGTLFGFAVAFVLLSLHLLPRDTFDVLALVQRWNKRRQYRDMVAQGYDPFGYAPGRASTAGGRAGVPPPVPDAATQRVLDLRAEVSEAIAHHKLDRAAELYAQLKALDPDHVLSRQAQYDVANQLSHAGQYPMAAEAYESLLKHHPRFEQADQVALMLGLIYSRYLGQYDKAREHLRRAAERLHGERELSLARDELSRIEPLLAAAQGPRA